MPFRELHRASRAWTGPAVGLGIIALALSACGSAPAETRPTVFHDTPPAAVQPADHLVLQAPPAPPRITTPGPARQAVRRRQTALAAPNPRILTAGKRLQCVPYAREQANIQIRGDAWTWWNQARGRYQRGQTPTVGSVLVLKRKGDSRGHLAVVSAIVNDREIITRHANWLNQGRIHLDTPVRDVSPGNDWSQVRVWYTPGKVLGKSSYAAYGFIYPPVETAVR